MKRSSSLTLLALLLVVLSAALGGCAQFIPTQVPAGDPTMNKERNTFKRSALAAAVAGGGPGGVDGIHVAGVGGSHLPQPGSSKTSGSSQPSVP